MSSKFFFDKKAYFQTSFKVPDDVTFDMIYLSLVIASTTKFRCLYSVMNQDHTEIEENASMPLFFEDISGDSLESVHQDIISRINEDTLYLFQFYKVTLSNGDRYITLNCHHGAADGQFVTCLFMFVYDSAYGSSYNLETLPDFTPYDGLDDLQNLSFPPNWGPVESSILINKPEFTVEDQDIDLCISKEEIHNEKSYTINLQTTVAADIIKRCFSHLKQQCTTERSCKHGLLLYMGMKALYNIQEKNKKEIDPKSLIGLSSVVNMRRYLKKGANNPMMCVNSVHFEASVSSLCDGTVTPQSLQSLSDQKLHEGLPLLFALQERNKVIPSASVCAHNVKDTQLRFEFSFLGGHPPYCFPRSKITQSILNPSSLNLVSCVAWINLDGSVELCISGNSQECSKEQLQSLLDELAYQFYDYSVV